MKRFEVRAAQRGVFFRIGNQEFCLANTDLDPDDPESQGHQEFMARMLYGALSRLVDDDKDV